MAFHSRRSSAQRESSASACPITPEEVDQLLLSSGFRLKESIPAGHNIARIYERSSANVFSGLLARAEVETISRSHSTVPDPVDTQIKVVEANHRSQIVSPTPQGFSLEELCIRRLRTIGIGPGYATEFHRLTELILRRVFQYSLKTFVIEQEIDEGTRRVDIVAKNYDESGFFRRLDSHYHIPCANIFIECKNYNKDPGNPEVDQLSSRLLDNRGMFGFLIYRRCANRDRLRTRLKTFVASHKYMIDLDQNDLIQLLQLRKESGWSQINEFLEAKLDQLTLRPE